MTILRLTQKASFARTAFKLLLIGTFKALKVAQYSFQHIYLDGSL